MSLSRLDFDPNQPRDRLGRFASKRGVAAIAVRPSAQGSSYKTSSGKTGPSGRVISSGEAYTKSLHKDKEFDAAHKRVISARDEIYQHRRDIETLHAEGKKIPQEKVEQLNEATARFSAEHQNFQKVATPKMTELQEQMKRDSGISREQAEAIVDSKQVKANWTGVRGNELNRVRLREDMIEYTQLTGYDSPSIDKVTVSGLHSRSFADPMNTKQVVISNSAFNRGEVYHEASHHFEYSNPSLVRAAEDWQKKRGDNGGQKIRLALVDPAYHPSEMAIKDAFWHVYAGKNYQDASGKTIATEAISMGMQCMDTPERMASLYAVDPEHFNFTVGAIAANRKRKQIKSDSVIEIKLDYNPYRDKQGRFAKKEAVGMGVWYEGRRTGVMVDARNKAEALEKANELKKQGGDGVVNIRELDEKEVEQAKKGKWVRTGPHGEKPGELDIPGYGPKPKKLRKDLIDSLRDDAGYGVWFGGRRTPIAVSAESRGEAVIKAKKKLKRGGSNVVSARTLNEGERSQAAKGNWIRTGPNGEAPGKSNLRGKGPEPKKKRSDLIDWLREDGWLPFDEDKHFRDENGRFSSKDRRAIDYGDKTSKVLRQGERFTNRLLSEKDQKLLRTIQHETSEPRQTLLNFDKELAFVQEKREKGLAGYIDTSKVKQANKNIFGLIQMGERADVKGLANRILKSLEANYGVDYDELQEQAGLDEDGISYLINPVNESSSSWIVRQTTKLDEDKAIEAEEALVKFYSQTGLYPSADYCVRGISPERNIGGWHYYDDRVDEHVIGLNPKRQDVDRVIFHEMGHLIEMEDQELAEASKEFIMGRSSGLETTHDFYKQVARDSSISKCYGGAFSNPYAGTIYNTQPRRPAPTELVSTGIETLSSADKLAKLIAEDPDHFFFIMGAIARNRAHYHKKSTTWLPGMSPEG